MNCSSRFALNVLLLRYLDMRPSAAEAVAEALHSGKFAVAARLFSEDVSLTILDCVIESDKPWIRVSGPTGELTFRWNHELEVQ